MTKSQSDAGLVGVAPFTLQELYDDIWGEEKDDGSGYYTARELADMWNVSPEKVRRILHAARDAGYVVDVSRGRRPTLDGRMAPVPVYRLRKPTGDG